MEQRSSIQTILSDLIHNGNLQDGKIGIYIFGTGQGGQSLSHYLTKNDKLFSPYIKGFLDNNLSKKDTRIDGILIYPPDQVHFQCNDYVFIASYNHCREMETQLLSIGVEGKKIILPTDYLSELLTFQYEPKMDFVANDLDYINGSRPQITLFNSDTYTCDILEFPVCQKPLVSIILPVCNQWDYTKMCLFSILTNTKDIFYEVIVADDGSNDETTNIDNHVENIRIIRNEKNLGFLQNCNNAARFARGKYLVFLNNDTSVQKDWLKHLLVLMEQEDTIGMVGSKLVYPDGRLQEAGGIIWQDGSGWNYGRLDDSEKPEYNYAREVDYISGASIMIRAALWDKIGGFDERFIPAYYEDTDLAFEVRRHGFKVVYQPKSIVVHFEGISHGNNVKTGIKNYQLRNRDIFRLKWEAVLKKEHFPSGENVFWSRDRSHNKQSILVIDHHVPYYDHDAGGRCTYQYLKLFVELGFHVIFIGDYCKHEPYTSDLEQMGIMVLYGSWYDNQFENWIKVHGNYIDFAYLNRPQISIKYIDNIRSYSHAKIIYFGHDLHYLREYRKYEIEKNTDLLLSSEKYKLMEFEIFDKVDVIHVVGTYEQDIIQQKFPLKQVRNIPLFIADDLQFFPQVFSKEFEMTKDIMFVGGFNHQPNVDAMLWFVNKIFPLILEKDPTIILYIVGSNPNYWLRKMTSPNIKVTGFLDDNTLRQYYEKIRLVVAPLRYGAGVKGKIIEAMLHMSPVITTTIGAEGLSDIENEIVVINEEDGFAEAVIALYHDKTLWKTRAYSAFQYVKDNFSKQKAIRILLADINQK